MTKAEAACIKSEMEYRSWAECPQWYCVKTTMNNLTGKVSAEFVVDENTKLPVILQQIKKPQDGVYETATETAYYTYHRGYEEAERQIKRAKMS